MEIEHVEHNGQDLTKGPIGKQLWSLAWPMMLSVFFYTLYNLVDAFWVSKISDEAIAAVSVSQIALFVMVAISMGLTVGSSVVMAMRIGAKNIPEAERVLGQSFVISTIVAIFFTGLSLIFRSDFLTLAGAGGAIYDPALAYFTVVAGGSILLFWLMTIMFAFNSQGDTFTLTKFFAISTGVNLVLDPLFIFGWGPIPEMGIAGAAIATLVSQAVFIAIALHALSNEKRIVTFHFHNLSFKWESVKEVLKIGVPASLTQVVNPLGLAALMAVTSYGFMESGVIAFSIGSRVEFFAMLPAIGFGFGAMAMMGQNIGAGNVPRAHAVFEKALLYSFSAAMAFGVLAIVGSRLIAGAFTQDPVIIGYVFSYILVIGLSYGLLTASMVEANAFQALGRSWPGFWIFVIKFFVISVPMAYIGISVFDFPIISVWIAIATGNVLAAIIGYIWIRRELAKVKPADSVAE